MKKLETVQELVTHSKIKIDEISSLIDLLYDNFLYVSNLIEGDNQRKIILNNLKELYEAISFCAKTYTKDGGIEMKHDSQSLNNKIVDFYGK